jgi:hypothetical protein
MSLNLEEKEEQRGHYVNRTMFVGLTAGLLSTSLDVLFFRAD